MSKETEELVPDNTAQITLSLSCRVRGLTDPSKLVDGMAAIEKRVVVQLRDHVSSLVRGCAAGVTCECSSELGFSDDIWLLQLTGDLEDVTGVPAEAIRTWLADVGIDVEPDETSEPEAETTPAEPVDPSSIVFEYACGLREGDYILSSAFGAAGHVIPPVVGHDGSRVAYRNREGGEQYLTILAITKASRDGRRLERTVVDSEFRFLPADEAEVETAETPAKQPFMYRCGLQEGDRGTFRQPSSLESPGVDVVVVAGSCSPTSVICKADDGGMNIIPVTWIIAAHRDDRLLNRIEKVDGDVCFYAGEVDVVAMAESSEPHEPSSPYMYPCGLQEGDQVWPLDGMSIDSPTYVTSVTDDELIVGDLDAGKVRCMTKYGDELDVPVRLIRKADRDGKQLVPVVVGGDVLFCESQTTDDKPAEEPVVSTAAEMAEEPAGLAPMPFVHACGLQEGDHVTGFHEAGRSSGIVRSVVTGCSPLRVCVVEGSVLDDNFRLVHLQPANIETATRQGVALIKQVRDDGDTVFSLPQGSE